MIYKHCNYNEQGDLVCKLIYTKKEFKNLNSRKVEYTASSKSQRNKARKLTGATC